MSEAPSLTSLATPSATSTASKGEMGEKERGKGGMVEVEGRERVQGRRTQTGQRERRIGLAGRGTAR